MGLLFTSLVQLMKRNTSLYYTTDAKHHLNHIYSFSIARHFVSASLGRIIKKFLSISSPCKKAVLISMAFNFHFFFGTINTNIILRASLEQGGEFFNISSKAFATNQSSATILLSMFLKDQTYFSDISFCPVYGTSV